MKGVTGKILANPVLKKAFVLFWWHRALLAVYLAAVTFCASLVVLAYCDASYYVSPSRRPGWIYGGLAVLAGIAIAYAGALLVPSWCLRRFLKFFSRMKPEASKVVDPLLSGEMLAKDHENVRLVLERRLTESFAGASMLERGSKHWLSGGAAAGVICVCLLFLPFRNAPDLSSKFALVTRWLEGSERQAPLKIKNIHPGDASVKSDSEWRLWVEFSRPVREDSIVIAKIWKNDEAAKTIELKRERPRVYQTIMPPITEPLRYAIEAEKYRSRVFAVNVHTQQSLDLTEARGLYPGKNGVINLDVTRRHWKLPAGTELALTAVSTDRVDTVYLVIGGDKRWDMVQLGEKGRWSRSIKLWDSGALSFKWLTDDGRGGVSDIYSVEVFPDASPRLDVTAPIEGEPVSAPVSVEVSASDDWGVSGVSVFLNDFMGNRRSYFHTTPQKSRFKGNFNLSEWKMRDLTGKVLAMKTSVRDDAVPKNITYWKTTFHPYVERRVTELLEPKPVTALFEKWLATKISGNQNSIDDGDDFNLQAMRKRREENKRRNGHEAALDDPGGSDQPERAEDSASRPDGDEEKNASREPDDNRESAAANGESLDGDETSMNNENGKEKEPASSSPSQRNEKESQGNGKKDEVEAEDGEGAGAENGGESGGSTDGGQRRQDRDGGGEQPGDENGDASDRRTGKLESGGGEDGERGEKAKGDGKAESGERDDETGKNENGDGKTDSQPQGRGQTSSEGENAGKRGDAGQPQREGGQDQNEKRMDGEADGGDASGGKQPEPQSQGQKGQSQGDGGKQGGAAGSQPFSGSKRNDSSSQGDSSGEAKGGARKPSGDSTGKSGAADVESAKPSPPPGDRKGDEQAERKRQGIGGGDDSKRDGKEEESRQLGDRAGGPGGAAKREETTARRSGANEKGGNDAPESEKRGIDGAAAEIGKTGKFSDRRGSSYNILKDPDQFNPDSIDDVKTSSGRLETERSRDLSTRAPLEKSSNQGVRAIPAGELEKVIRANAPLRKRLPERERVEAEEYYRRLKDIDFVE